MAGKEDVVCANSDVHCTAYRTCSYAALFTIINLLAKEREGCRDIPFPAGIDKINLK